jgi:hypothetical protein
VQAVEIRSALVGAEGWGGVLVVKGLRKIETYSQDYSTTFLETDYTPSFTYKMNNVGLVFLHNFQIITVGQRDDMKI